MKIKLVISICYLVLVCFTCASTKGPLLGIRARDFLNGIILGTSETTDNQCVLKSKAVIDRAEAEIPKIIENIIEMKWPELWLSIREIFSSLISKETEEYCHFERLSTQLGDQYEIIKAGFRITQNIPKIQAAVESIILAFQRKKLLDAGKGVGIILNLAFEYKTQ